SGNGAGGRGRHSLLRPRPARRRAAREGVDRRGSSEKIGSRDNKGEAMGFFSDVFNRTGRVARGQVNAGVGALEDATFESTVRQTVADMKTELNNVVRSSAMAMSNYNRLDAEYQKYVKQSQEWKDRAGLALDAGNEDLARKALAKKAESDKQVA